MNDKKKFLVIGSGVASLSCAKLLADADSSVTIYDSKSTTIPILVLNKFTYDLLSEIWKIKDQLIRKSYPIYHKNVLWNSLENTLDQHYLVLDGQTLLEILRKELSDKYEDSIKFIDTKHQNINVQDNLKSFDRVVNGGGSNTVFTKQLKANLTDNFGNRCIMSTFVKTNKEFKNSIFMESVKHGWVFLAPFSNEINYITGNGSILSRQKF